MLDAFQVVGCLVAHATQQKVSLAEGRVVAHRCRGVANRVRQVVEEHWRVALKLLQGPARLLEPFQASLRLEERPVLVCNPKQGLRVGGSDERSKADGDRGPWKAVELGMATPGERFPRVLQDRIKERGQRRVNPQRRQIHYSICDQQADGEECVGRRRVKAREPRETGPQEAPTWVGLPAAKRRQEGGPKDRVSKH
eukprot:scaffold537_cov241-Pinguiococcus_pyrenoidosus.AAC.19